MLSQRSVARPWVNFEAGAAWLADKMLIPVCYGNLSKDALPHPYSGIQALNLPSEAYYLLKSVNRQLNLDPMSSDAVYRGTLCERLRFRTMYLDTLVLLVSTPSFNNSRGCAAHPTAGSHGSSCGLDCGPPGQRRADPPGHAGSSRSRTAEIHGNAMRSQSRVHDVQCRALVAPNPGKEHPKQTVCQSASAVSWQNA
jgi:hypothetical protein